MNKWDLVKDDGRGEAAVRELSDLLECEEHEILRVSAKTGLGVESVLEGVVDRIPPPSQAVKGEELRALAFDSYYDTFRGVVSLVAVVEGEIKKGESLERAVPIRLLTVSLVQATLSLQRRLVSPTMYSISVFSHQRRSASLTT